MNRNNPNRRPCVRVPNSWTASEVAVLDKLCSFAVAGKDARVIARGQAFASVMRKTRSMVEKSAQALAERDRWLAENAATKERQRVQKRRDIARAHEAHMGAVAVKHAELDERAFAAIVSGARSNDDIAKRAGLSFSQARAAARRLRERGAVRSSGGRGRRWVAMMQSEAAQ